MRRFFLVLVRVTKMKKQMKTAYFIVGLALPLLVMSKTAVGEERLLPTPNPGQLQFLRDFLRTPTDRARAVRELEAGKTGAGALRHTEDSHTGGDQNRVTTFHVFAHPDDDDLFMYPYWDVTTPNVSVVFIVLTAGDGGFGAGPSTPGPYYVAREAGTQAAINWLADVKDATVARPVKEIADINGHKIGRVKYKNTTAYYLHLPDGNLDGSGFPADDNESLQKLESGAIGTITTIDGSTKYDGWTDLISTLQAIIVTHGAGQHIVWLNSMDPDPEHNPGTHSDHMTTGKAALALQKSLPCLNLALFADYATTDQINVPIDITIVKAALFAVNNAAKADHGWPGDWEAGHLSFMRELVYRVQQGAKDCEF